MPRKYMNWTVLYTVHFQQIWTHKSPFRYPKKACRQVLGTASLVSPQRGPHRVVKWFNKTRTTCESYIMDQLKKRHFVKVSHLDHINDRNVNVCIELLDGKLFEANWRIQGSRSPSPQFVGATKPEVFGSQNKPFLDPGDFFLCRLMAPNLKFWTIFHTFFMCFGPDFGHDLKIAFTFTWDMLTFAFWSDFQEVVLLYLGYLEQSIRLPSGSVYHASRLGWIDVRTSQVTRICLSKCKGHLKMTCFFTMSIALITISYVVMFQISLQLKSQGFRHVLHFWSILDRGSATLWPSEPTAYRPWPLVRTTLRPASLYEFDTENFRQCHRENNTSQTLRPQKTRRPTGLNKTQRCHTKVLEVWDPQLKWFWKFLVIFKYIKDNINYSILFLGLVLLERSGRFTKLAKHCLIIMAAAAGFSDYCFPPNGAQTWQRKAGAVDHCGSMGLAQFGSKWSSISTLYLL